MQKAKRNHENHVKRPTKLVCFSDKTCLPGSGIAPVATYDKCVHTDPEMGDQRPALLLRHNQRKIVFLSTPLGKTGGRYASARGRAAADSAARPSMQLNFLRDPSLQYN